MNPRRALLPVLIAFFSLAGTAQAGTLSVSVSGSSLEIDGDHTRNLIDVRLEAERYVIHHNGPINTAGGCHVYGSNAPLTPADAVCPSAGVTLLEADLGDGADVFRTSAGLPTKLEGGSGDDLLVGGGSYDVLDGGPGSDELIGGPGRDRADYSSRTAPLNVTLDGAANDGEVGEVDDVDVEEVVGGAGNDHLTGSALPDRLLGGAGDDTLDGLAGGDTLVGGPDDDVHNGGDGSDVLVAGAAGDGEDEFNGGAGPFDEVSYAARTTAVTVDLDGVADDGASGERDNADVEWVTGGTGNDWLIGNDGPNLLTGGGGQDFLGGHAGNDTLLAGAGNDVANGNDGNDAINGGPGADFLFGAAGDDALNAFDGIGANDDLVGVDGRDSCQSDVGDRETTCEY